MVVQEAQEFVEAALADAELAAALGGQRPTLLFCGDLNSGLLAAGAGPSLLPGEPL